MPGPTPHGPRVRCGPRMVSTRANIAMPFDVEYFHPRVLSEIEAWPVDMLADFARLIELVIRHGPDLRMPHSRALGDWLFELRARGRSGSGRAFYCFVLGHRVVVLHAFVKKTRRTPDRELQRARRRQKELEVG